MHLGWEGPGPKAFWPGTREGYSGAQMGRAQRHVRDAGGVLRMGQAPGQAPAQAPAQADFLGSILAFTDHSYCPMAW